MDWHWARHSDATRHGKAAPQCTSRITSASSASSRSHRRRRWHAAPTRALSQHPPTSPLACPGSQVRSPSRRFGVLALALPSTQACTHCTSREPNAHLGPPVAGDLGARARRRRAGALPQAARDPPRPKTRAIAPSPSPPARALGLGPRGAPQLPLGKRGARARRRPLGPIARLARVASLAHRFLPPLRPRSQPNQPLSLINHA